MLCMRVAEPVGAVIGKPEVEIVDCGSMANSIF